MGEIPESFNTYEKWPQFCHPIRNQERCGSCWAFAASEVLSDRFAIASNGAVNKVLSPEDMVSCDSGDMGCGGGYLDHAWQYLCETGVVTDSCFPYGAGGGRAPACVSKCVDGEPYTKYKARAPPYCSPYRAPYCSLHPMAPQPRARRPRTSTSSRPRRTSSTTS